MGSCTEFLLLQEKAKELQRKRYEEMKRGGGKSSAGYGSSGGYGSSFQSSQAPSITDSIPTHTPQVLDIEDRLAEVSRKYLLGWELHSNI